METTKYPLALPNSPSFFINDNATPEEQAQVFLNLVNGRKTGTGIVSHEYTGRQQDLGANVKLSNQEYVVDSSATNPRNNPDIVPSMDLIPGGFGMPENLLLNFPSSDGLWHGKPVWDYSPMEIINSLAIYQGSRTRSLDFLNDIVDSNEYDWFTVALPANESDATIAWKDTFRTQVSVPPESFLVMIGGIDNLAVEVPNGFRLQIFDDGAGEYLLDTPFNSLLVSGSEVSQGLSSNAVGPYLLQSPLAIVAPGLLTVTLSNTNASNDEAENPVEAFLMLVFATPKRCKNLTSFKKEMISKALVLEA